MKEAHLVKVYQPELANPCSEQHVGSVTAYALKPVQTLAFARSRRTGGKWSQKGSYPKPNNNNKGVKDPLLACLPKELHISCELLC